jgi:enediyne biosynthesis protein E4
VILASCRDHSKNTLFHKLPSDRTGIHFDNRIVENDSINPIDLEFLYNGGGIGVADFNRDGLPDLYFTGSQVSNKLFLNRGNLRFEDITERAGVTGEGRWCTGVSVVDINNDGWPDIYVCASIRKDPAQRTNLLYVNQGLDKNGIPIFKEMAAEYGLADTSYSVQAAFFDYDNDGDLDMYLVTTKLAERNVAQFSFNNNGSGHDHTDVDKLYRNTWSDSLKHPIFTDVSAQAGIVQPGYGLGVSIVDINRDGWKDIYVSNDFLSSDLLYINNGDGTFTNKIGQYFKHTSQNAMGNDIADINNDGLADLLTVDMDPADNYRKKKNMGGSNYGIYQQELNGNFMLQYVRNTLQLNQGPRVNGSDSIGDPVFSDIGFYTGTAETDWSWNPSIADMDNDGYRDILITNGYPRDVTDHDYTTYKAAYGAAASKQDLIAHIPQIKIPNYAFRNLGDLKFENKTREWGLDAPSFSNGAVCVDLDNDGDLDYVVNNIDDEAFVYENTTNTTAKDNPAPHWLDIRFAGDKKNVDGIGTFAQIYYDSGRMQVYENSPYRGYLSTAEASAHFGLGRTKVVDSVVVKWPNGKKQVLLNVRANQTLTANIQNARLPWSFDKPVKAANPLFTDVTAITGVTYRHHERDYIDFNLEKLLPHKLSQYGPSLAAGDLDGNGLDDLFIGTSAGTYVQQYLLQQADGKFVNRQLPPLAGKDPGYGENLGTLIFDADGDGRPDIYCAGGSNEFPAGSKNYQDRLWMNLGKGSFILDTTGAVPLNYTSKSCVKAADFDHDGHLDLFVGGRVLPGSYPLPVSSFIYRNESRPGKPKFVDVTDSVAPGLKNIGMVTDAIWTDFDNDGWIDLIVVGEWMPVTFFKNDHGKLVNVTARSDVASETGWWNSITAGDFDNDGDIDYIVGNLGENAFLRPSDTTPVSIYAKDFDGNQSLDAVLTLYLPDRNGVLREFPAASRDEMIRQMPVLKKQFPSYKDYAEATFADIFPPQLLAGAYTRHANRFQSVYLENLGQGRFAMHPLPAMAQLAPVYGMVTGDFDQDGNLDVALTGNDYGNEVTSGRYDAFNGLILLGDGRGNFTPRTILQSGLFIPGDGKALVELQGPGNTLLLAASQNNGPLRLFKSDGERQLIRVKDDDRLALIYLRNGKIRRQELGYGSSFGSQSARIIQMDKSILRVELIDAKGQRRTITNH